MLPLYLVILGFVLNSRQIQLQLACYPTSNGRALLAQIIRQYEGHSNPPYILLIAPVSKRNSHRAFRVFETAECDNPDDFLDQIEAYLTPFYNSHQPVTRHYYWSQKPSRLMN